MFRVINKVNSFFFCVFWESTFFYKFSVRSRVSYRTAYVTKRSPVGLKFWISSAIYDRVHHLLQNSLWTQFFHRFKLFWFWLWFPKKDVPPLQLRITSVQSENKIHTILFRFPLNFIIKNTQKYFQEYTYDVAGLNDKNRNKFK